MFDFFNMIFTRIENKKITSKVLFMLITTLIFDITLRHLLEINLIDTQNITDPNKNWFLYIRDEIKFYYENFSYFILLFLGMNFFISKILNQNISKMINFAVYFYPFIIIPPLLDFFIFHSLFNIEYVKKFIEYGYSYGSVQNYFNNILTLSWNTGDTSYGISLLVTIGVLTSSFYVYFRSKNFPLLKSIFTFIMIDIMIMTISTPDLFYGDRIANYQKHDLLPLFYYLPILFASYLIAWNEKLLNKELKTIGLLYFVLIPIIYYDNSLRDFYIVNLIILLLLVLFLYVLMFKTHNFYYLNINFLFSFVLSGFILEFNIYLYLIFVIVSLLVILLFLFLNKDEKS